MNNDTEILRSNINEYLKLNEAINKQKQQLKILNTNKKKYEENIIQFMKNQNISDINSANSKIKFNTSLRKENLSKKIIKDQMTKYFEQDDRFKNLDINNEVENIITFVYKNRERTVLDEKLTIKNI